MKIANDLGHEVSFEAMRRDDLYLADEAFLTGTAAEVVPIASVDDRVVGDGKPGPITTVIQYDLPPSGARRATPVRGLARPGLVRPRVTSTRGPTNFFSRSARRRGSTRHGDADPRDRPPEEGGSAALRPSRRSGRGFGTPAPGEGYALTIAARECAKLDFARHQDDHDVAIGIGLVAAKRASTVGRGPHAG